MVRPIITYSLQIMIFFHQTPSHDPNVNNWSLSFRAYISGICHSTGLRTGTPQANHLQFFIGTWEGLRAENIVRRLHSSLSFFLENLSLNTK